MIHAPIQIVDEDDNPIGEADMFEARAKGLVHRIVRIMVEDGKGNILLQKRSPTIEIYPNCWDLSAAGHVDVGEDYLTAAKRELAEELGVKDAKLIEVDIYYTERPLGDTQLRRFNRLYRTTVPKEVSLHIDPVEVGEVKWFSLDEAKDLIKKYPQQITDGLQDIIERYY